MLRSGRQVASFNHVFGEAIPASRSASPAPVPEWRQDSGLWRRCSSARPAVAMIYRVYAQSLPTDFEVLTAIGDEFVDK